jgi:hypothetical protein
MSLWNNEDEANSAPQYTVDITTGNTGVEAYNVEPIGTWGVDAGEAQASNVNGHAGWVLRTVGSGGRSGRVTEETLVAMGSMTGDGEDDAVYPDAIITILTQPTNDSVVANTEGANSVTFTVDATSTPEVTLSYQWEYNDGATWESVDDDTPANTTYSGETTPSLEVTPTSTESNGALYRVVVSADGAPTVISSNVTLTVV